MKIRIEDVKVRVEDVKISLKKEKCETAKGENSLKIKDVIFIDDK